VPVLILAGQRDTYHNCCLIDSMRAIERGARERSAVFELVVYPYAEHGFNLQRSAYYRGDDEADAWKRTVDMLRRYQPLRYTGVSRPVPCLSGSRRSKTLPPFRDAW